MVAQLPKPNGIIHRKFITFISKRDLSHVAFNICVTLVMLKYFRKCGWKCVNFDRRRAIFLYTTLVICCISIQERRPPHALYLLFFFFSSFQDLLFFSSCELSHLCLNFFFFFFAPWKPLIWTSILKGHW